MKEGLVQAGVSIFFSVLLLIPATAAETENAADLYNKAFKLYKQSPEGLKEKFENYVSGENPISKEIEEYLKSQQPVIHLVEQASRINRCDWDFVYLKDPNHIVPPYVSPARNLTRILIADARLNVSQKNYTEAFQKCRTLFKMVYHIDENIVISHLVSLSSKAFAYDFLQDLLNTESLDVGTLEMIQNLLSEGSKSQFDWNKCIDYELNYHKTHAKESLTEIFSIYLKTGDLDHPIPVVDYISNDFIERNLSRLSKQSRETESLLEQPYSTAFPGIEEIQSETKKDLRKYLRFCCDPNNLEISYLSMEDLDYLQACDSFFASFFPLFNTTVYSIDTRVQTELNALKTAVNLYRIKIRIGHLPDTLPYDQPTDLFSGKPFLYEITTTGFVLRCQGKDLSRDKIHEWEFRVR